jgi:hypothetical protein
MRMTLNTQRSELAAIREAVLSFVSTPVARVTEYRASVVDPGPRATVDARSDRAVESIVGIVLLGAFVFRLPWLVPILTLILAAGAVGGPGANLFHLGFRRLIEPRLPVVAAAVPAATVRAQDALLAALGLLASLAFLIDIDLVGWLFVVAAALVAIFAATTMIHIGERALGRFL